MLPRGSNPRGKSSYTPVSSVEVVVAQDEENVVIAKAATILDGDTSSALAEGLTWTDTFFEENNNSTVNDPIVAVFDYDLDQIQKLKQQEQVLAAVSVALSVCVVGFILSGVVQTSRWVMFFVWLPFLVAIVGACLGRGKPTITPLERKDCNHTAVMRSGVRHVQPSLPNCPGYILHIPFEDIDAITVRQANADNPHCILVQLTLASEDDGFEYIHSGFHAFSKSTPNAFSPSKLVLNLVGLKEPVRFKKLVMAMRDAQMLNNNSKNRQSRRGEKLLTRLEVFLDKCQAPSGLILGHAQQALTELVAELREFNQSSSSPPVAVELSPDSRAIV